MAKDLMEQWELIMLLVGQVDSDMRKNAKNGNLSAGVRARKALRLLKGMMHDIQVESQKHDKIVKAERKERFDPNRKLINMRNLQKKPNDDDGQDT